MIKNRGKQQVYRVCAVCKRRHGVTYGYKHILQRFGIQGDKATNECVRKLQRQATKVLIGEKGL